MALPFFVLAITITDRNVVLVGLISKTTFQEEVCKNRMNLFSFIFNFWIFFSARDSHIYGLMFISEAAVEPCYNV